jgi:hypothetical protein
VSAAASAFFPGAAFGAARTVVATSAAAAPLHIEEETHCRQRSLLVLEDKTPLLCPQVYVAPNAVVVGDVDIQDAVGFGDVTTQFAPQLPLHLTPSLL